MSQSSHPSRIILVNGSRLLHELVSKAIAQSPGLKIAAEVINLRDFPETVIGVKADWICLLLPRGEKIPSCIEDFLHQKSTIGLLVLSTDGSQVLTRCPGCKQAPVDPRKVFEILRCTSSEAIRRIV